MVTACGICGTDLHLLHGMTMPAGASYPVVPGHEVAGTVVELGDGLTDLTVGESVVLHPLTPCGRCEPCTTGAEQRCDNARILGIHDPGGMADEVVWPAHRMVATGDVPVEQAALLPDAVATAWHALARAEVPRGGTLVVIGAGGVGTHVLQLAAAVDPDITTAAVVRSEASARRLEELGLGVVITGLDGAARKLRAAIPLADAVIDFSGAPTAPGEGLRALRRGGTLVLGSVVDENLDLRTTTTALVTREVRIVGSYASSIDDLRTVTELARSGALDLSGSASLLLDLDDAPRAFELLEERPPGLVRAVLRP
jgi:2-desacetyl-2-hydroxyethyl bacteriochlorophyllide A dehydrogenase